MVAHGLDADEQALTDLTVSHTIADKLQDFYFTACQPIGVGGGRYQLLAAGAIVFLAGRLKGEVERRPDSARRLLARATLIGKIQERTETMLKRGLYPQARAEFDLAMRPLRLAWIDEPDVPIRQPIATIYRQLGGPLVILGEPGTGKTTLLHELPCWRKPGRTSSLRRRWCLSFRGGGRSGARWRSGWRGS